MGILRGALIPKEVFRSAIKPGMRIPGCGGYESRIAIGVGRPARVSRYGFRGHSKGSREDRINLPLKASARRYIPWF